MKVSRVLVFGWIGLLSYGACAADAPGGRALAAAHAKAGVSCFDCHQQQAPSARPADAKACMDCHGDGPAMADATRKLPVNPHAPPPAPHPALNACPECHRQHQPPVVKCLECHPKFTLALH